MIDSENLYREKIKELFYQRQNINAKYSFRALARDLGIDASDLINIINDKKKVTPKMAYRIGVKLKLQNESLLSFILPTLK